MYYTGTTTSVNQPKPISQPPPPAATENPLSVVGKYMHHVHIIRTNILSPKDV